MNKKQAEDAAKKSIELFQKIINLDDPTYSNIVWIESLSLVLTSIIDSYENDQKEKIKQIVHEYLDTHYQDLTTSLKD